MEPPSPDGKISQSFLDEMPKLFDLLTQSIFHKNSSGIAHFTNTDQNNFPAPTISLNDLFTNQYELGTNCIPGSNINEKKPDLLTGLDGCSSDKSLVISPSTTYKRSLFDYPEIDASKASNHKKFCNIPTNKLFKIQTASSVTLHNAVSASTVSVEELEKEKDDYIPPSNLTYLENHLRYLINNIYLSMSKTGLNTTQDSYCMALDHIMAFKNFIINHGNHLADYNDWPVIMDYVFMAWKYVKSTPKWDNPLHNTERRQCYTSLLRLCMTAINKMEDQLNTLKQEQFIKELKLINDCKDEVKKCLQLLDFDVTTQ